MVKLLKAEAIYDKFKNKFKRQIKSLPPLTLASLVIGKDYSIGVYLLSQKKLADELGVNYLAVDLDSNISLQQAVDRIIQLNEDKKITAIVANKPFPRDFAEEAIFSAINFKKDIEGMNPYNLGKLFMGEPIFISPTVLSVLEFIRMTKVDLYGKDVTIVGFSTLIGKPLALLLGRQFATVSITHIATYERERLPFYIKNADIVISAVGKPNIIKGNWIKKGAIVIDVGIGEKDGKLAGDIEFAIAKDNAAFITPVPGGIGKLTSLFLFKNLIQAHQKYYE
ncbi:MAG: bifunctional 5,10-methylenetetrahydrofolate dehydrogenase/5,10-methenyltetrahydrofolate cyclohydrolase [Candidatus Omnitrophota bacterium]|nr:bifunctional 5,10-methylenetetrahydrofolate dehydrogenase/5,10-methenyltetrahydrofolate cyclohydrolase [Candidatus Omnitrophota bacterium]